MINWHISQNVLIESEETKIYQCMQWKNFSLIETKPAGRNFALSKAYDMLPVNVILPEDTEQMALTVNGKKRNIRKKDFLELALKCGIDKKIAENLIQSIVAKKDKLLHECELSNLPEESKEKTKELILARMNLLSLSTPQ